MTHGKLRKPRHTYVKRAVRTKRTLRWIGHSRSFKVILIGAGVTEFSPPGRDIVLAVNNRPIMKISPSPWRSWGRRLYHGLRPETFLGGDSIACHRQKSRTLCRRNVHINADVISETCEDSNGKAAECRYRYIDLNYPSPVWRRSCKKRPRISTNDLYSQKLELLSYIFATDSMRLCLLLFTQLFLKVKRSESIIGVGKRILTRNSHSRSF